MKTLSTIICLFMLMQPSFILAESDPANPKKVERPCGFPDDMNCLENGEIADAPVVNANFKYLIDKIKFLEDKIEDMEKKITENSNGLANKIIKGFDVNISELQKYSSVCSEESLDSIHCNHAICYYCRSQGFTTGFPMHDYNNQNVCFFCIK